MSNNFSIFAPSNVLNDKKQHYMELSEQEIVRRQSLQTMREMGIDPYPAAEYEVTGYSTEIKAGFVDDDNVQRNGIQETPYVLPDD